MTTLTTLEEELQTSSYMTFHICFLFTLKIFIFFLLDDFNNKSK
jgi:hypothetical protein